MHSRVHITIRFISVYLNTM